MKKVLGTLAAGAILATGLVSNANATKPLNELNFKFGVQHRVMYNNSNIASTKQYDFFRQRLRVDFDVSTEDGVGTFFQIEYRGGWGGSSPSSSDPRGTYAINAFNRLQARGLRYGYLYAPVGPGTVLAGILPANDEVNQMLFSADWDLNVGGIAYAGKAGGVNWRAAYVRLVEGVGLIKNASINKDQDEHFVILDLDTDMGGAKVGAHLYGAYGKVCIPATGQECIDTNNSAANDAPATKLNQTWIALTASAGPLSGVIIQNNGKIGNNSTSGALLRVEGNADLGKAKVGVLGVYSTGKSNGNGFKTVHNILGTGGYWGYTYIFIPHGPSDVNDFGLEVGNKGYGLKSVQAKADIGLTKGISLQVVAGYFASNKDMAGYGKNLGTEEGIQFTFNLGKYMNLEVGTAFAQLGNAGKAMYQGNNKSSVNETFARMQIEF